MFLTDRKYIFFISFFSILILVSRVSAELDYSINQDLELLIEELVLEEGFEKKDLLKIFSGVKRKDSILELMRRPAEKTKPWHKYRDIFVTRKRIRDGLLFYRKNESILARAEEKFGVPREIIVSIIGVETFYGGNSGSHRVIDALSTLAFHYPAELKNYVRRKSFFTKELKHYLILTARQGLDPLSLKGSYAGAMGLGQFMPSSYRAYAVDFDQDERIDIWGNVADAIGSVANYLARHGWREGEKIAVRAEFFGNHSGNWINTDLKPVRTVDEFADMGFFASSFAPSSLATAMAMEGEEGIEYWMGFQNFYVITRYNHSAMYALSVFQLAQSIKRELIVAK